MKVGERERGGERVCVLLDFQRNHSVVVSLSNTMLFSGYMEELSI